MIRPNLQKDDNGNFVYYPCIFFAKNGYLLPDEETADKLDDSYMIIAALPILWLALNIGISFLIVASLLYCSVIFILRYKSVRKFPKSNRKFSWEYYANTIGNRHSKLKLYLLSCVMFCSLSLPICMLLDRPNTTFIIVGLFLLILLSFCFFMSLLVIYFKK